MPLLVWERAIVVAPRCSAGAAGAGTRIAVDGLPHDDEREAAAVHREQRMATIQIGHFGPGAMPETAAAPAALPVEAAGFEPATVAFAGAAATPAPSTPAAAIVEALTSLGVAAVGVTLVDTESMACTPCWRVAADGSLEDLAGRGAGGFFPTAMATIVHLSRTARGQIVRRRLEPGRWGFAWRHDDRFVAVADVDYASAHDEAGDAEATLVQELCDELLSSRRGARAGAAGAAATATEVSRWSSWVAWLPGRLQASNEPMPSSWPSAAAAAEAVAEPQALPYPPAGPAAGFARAVLALPRLTLARLAAALLAAYLVIGAIAYAAQVRWQYGSEALRLRAVAEATLLQRLAKTLTAEPSRLTSEMEAFAALQYFERAVVTVDERVVAVAGARREFEAGDTLTPAYAGAATVNELRAANRVVGHLYRWGDLGRDAATAAAPAPASLVVAAAACLAATGLAVALLRRRVRGAAAEAAV